MKKTRLPIKSIQSMQRKVRNSYMTKQLVVLATCLFAGLLPVGSNAATYY